MSDLDVMYPAGQEVKVGGESLTVKPLKFGQLAQASRLMSPIARQVAAALKTDDDRTLADTASVFVDLMAAGGDDLMNALGFFVGKPREWFDTLEMDDGLRLMQAVYEVNADFFRVRVLPMFAKAAAVDPQTGATSSEPSSAPATTEATSTATP